MTDVVVVGGGVAGLCAAEQLAMAGARVALVEAEHLGAGASGQAGGQLLLGVVDAPWRIVASLGEARTRELFTLAEQSMRYLAERDLLVRTGQVSIAVDSREPDELERSARVLEAMGVMAELHPEGEAERRFGLAEAGPLLATAIGGRVRPAEALARLAEHARHAGAEILQQSPVRRIDEAADGLLIYAGERQITTEIVVWAAGVGTRVLESALEPSMTTVREQALSIEGLASTPAEGARAGFGYTWFERDDTTGWVGGCRWATPHLEVGEVDPVVEPRVQARIEAFAGRLGWTAERPIARRWAWIEAHSRDHLPLIGPVPGAHRLLACTALCGNDWGLGPAAAGLVTEGLLGVSAAASGLFAPSRFL